MYSEGGLTQFFGPDWPSQGSRDSKASSDSGTGLNELGTEPTKFGRQNQLKDLGFKPIKREKFRYALAYGKPNEHGVYAIEYREDVAFDKYRIYFFGTEIAVSLNDQWLKTTIKINTALDVLSVITESAHAKACTASYN